MSRPSNLTRRELVRGAVLAGAAAACSLPASASWAARGARRRSLRLLFFTDVHARLEWDTPQALEMAARAINARKPELIIAGGDLITDGFQSSAATVENRWQAYLEMHRALRAPVVPVIGNHDLVAAIPEDGTPPSADPRAQFREQLGVSRTFCSFNVQGYQIIVLDSIVITGGELKYHGRIGDQQLQWLRTELARIEPATPIVLATHVPLLTAFYQATEGTTFSAPANRVVVNNLELLELLEGHNLLLVLQGHLHVDELLRWRKTTFITGGAVCGRWWRGPWHGTRPGFGLVTLRPDRVEWEYLTHGWQARRPPGV